MLLIFFSKTLESPAPAVWHEEMEKAEMQTSAAAIRFRRNLWTRLWEAVSQYQVEGIHVTYI